MRKKVMDLFCGAGGFSYGFDSVDGFRVVCGIDNDYSAIDTFRKNHPYARGFNKDLSDIDIEEIHNEVGDIDVIIGGPPCKGFSSIRPDRGSDDIDYRNYLYKDYLDMVDYFEPSLFVLENVPDIVNHTTKSGENIFDKVKERIEDMGYDYEWKIVDASNYGVAQKRERFILIAVKMGSVPWPEPEDKTVTVKEVFEGLCRLSAGEESQDELHYATNHSDSTIEIISYADEKISDIPECIRPNGYNTSYTRLRLDDAATTLTTNFTIASSTRSIHPVENRALTLREGARIQSFPDDFEFSGSKTDIASQIGNAVPVKLSKSIAEELIKKLEPEQEKLI